MTTQRLNLTSNALAADNEGISRPDCGVLAENEVNSEQVTQGEEKGILCKSKNERGWRKIVRNFTPS
jgi:hypothetical protein